jgi:hypothetical protein
MQRMQVRRLAFWPVLTAVSCALCFVLIPVFNFALDPFHLFRADRVYVKDANYQRHANAGIILTDPPFDALVIGGSYIANFTPELVDRLFAVASRVLSVWGGSQKEVSTTLRFALRKRPALKAVFYNVSVWGLCSEGDHPFWPLPARLYADDPLGYAEALFSRGATTLAFLKVIKVTGLGKPGLDRPEGAFFTDDVRSVPRWDDNRTDLFGSAERLRKVLAESARNPPATLTPAEVESRARDILPCFERHVLSLVREHPATRFYIFNTPTFQWWHWAWNTHGMTAVWDRAQTLIAEALAQHANAEYHDFFAAIEIVNDCTRFRDMGHFDLRTGDELVALLRRGDYRRTPATDRWISQRALANTAQLVACPPARIAQNAL